MSTAAILMYHSVADATTPALRGLTVTPARFDAQLGALQAAGVRFVPFGEVPARLARAGDGRPVVAVTLDDALADVWSGAIPVLRRRAIPATVFVPTAYVGHAAGWLDGADGRRPLLDWAQLGALAGWGIEVGAHGHRHLAADVHAPAVVRDDARRARDLLERRLGRPVRGFAFPYGYGPRPARAAVRDAGFSAACVVADLPARTGDDPFALPRLHVRPDMTPAALVALVRRSPSAPRRRWALLKQEAWTVGRRHLGWGPDAPPSASAVAGAGR